MILFLLILAFSANAVMDKIQFHWRNSVFSNLKDGFWYHFWNPKLSWMNKWKFDDKGNPVKRRGKLVERFWGSSRWFVFLTDGWHLMKFIWINSLILALSHKAVQVAIADGVVTSYWISLLIAFTFYGIVGRLAFVLLFDIILKRKHN